MAATSVTVLIAWRILCSSRCPRWLDMTTFAPIEIPIKRLMSRLMTGALLPTAAKALLLAKRPTTATSTELNNCCKRLLAARGNAKINIFIKSGPFSMSTFSFVVFVLLIINSYLLQNYGFCFY